MPAASSSPAFRAAPVKHHAPSMRNFLRSVGEFREFKKKTRVLSLKLPGMDELPVYVNEFWTSRQRAAHSLHEISYRACFKPQLPGFFISGLTAIGDVVYDPFMGRGTTLIEAALSGRVPYGCDVNPLSSLLVRSRLSPPALPAVVNRLTGIRLNTARALREELLEFYHPETLRELMSLRSYLLRRRKNEELDSIDAWIWMVSLNRLTGHSPGFFSVYTLPPNQAVSVRSQRKINQRRQQVPPRRAIVDLIERKSRQLMRDVTPEMQRMLALVCRKSKILCGPADETPEIRSKSVHLVVTSPPFLDIVDYVQDNWLRAWFGGFDLKKVAVWQWRRLSDWEAAMEKVFTELHRVLVPGGCVAFEVGEVRNGELKLEEAVVRAGSAAGLKPRAVIINDQVFTKTSNCWGVKNHVRGTNTNRIVLFQRQEVAAKVTR
jgi:hypothetical protein